MPHVMTLEGARSMGALGASDAPVSVRLDELARSGVISQVGTSTAKPEGIPVLTIDQVEDLYARKWYKKWWVWSLVGLGVVGTGLTIYVVKKRRRGRR